MKYLVEKNNKPACLAVTDKPNTHVLITHSFIETIVPSNMALDFTEYIKGNVFHGDKWKATKINEKEEALLLITCTHYN